MSFRCIVFVVLMMFWLLGSGYYVYGQAASPAFYAATFIPWACVAILGWCVFDRGGNPH